VGEPNGAMAVVAVTANRLNPRSGAQRMLKGLVDKVVAVGSEALGLGLGMDLTREVAWTV
jgi:hypothetical protein